MKHSLEDVLSAISGEREYQKQRWPSHKHEVGAYLNYMWHYMHLASSADSTIDGSNPAQLWRTLEPIRKLAALGVACMEENGIVPRGANFVEGPVDLETVFLAVVLERHHQAATWPEYEHATETSSDLTLIRRYLQKADEAWADNYGDAQALDVIRKVVAIAVRCMQNNGAPQRLPLNVQFGNDRLIGSFFEHLNAAHPSGSQE